MGGGFLALGLLATLLRLFSAPEDAAPRPSRPSSTYLHESTGAMSSRRDEARRRRAEQAARVMAARRGQGFEHARSSRIFTVPGRGDAARREELRDLLTSDDVLIRLFGRPEGDFLFHRTHGWLTFRDGEWLPVEPGALPAWIRTAYPAEADYRATDTDRGFLAEDWKQRVDARDLGDP